MSTAMSVSVVKSVFAMYSVRGPTWKVLSRLRWIEWHPGGLGLLRKQMSILSRTP